MVVVATKIASMGYLQHFMLFLQAQVEWGAAPPPRTITINFSASPSLLPFSSLPVRSFRSLLVLLFSPVCVLPPEPALEERWASHFGHVDVFDTRHIADFDFRLKEEGVLEI